MVVIYLSWKEGGEKTKQTKKNPAWCYGKTDTVICGDFFKVV